MRVVAIRSAALGHRSARVVLTWSHWVLTVVSSIPANTVRNSAATMSWGALGIRARRFRAKWTRQR